MTQRPLTHRLAGRRLRGVILAVVALAAAAPAAVALDVPIYESETDGQAANCGMGTVMGLKAGGDGFLAVRSGPGAGYRKLGELHNGDRVMIIDGRDGWLGIVVPGGRVDQRDYCARVGPKRKLSGSGLGWVSGKWIGDIIP